MIQYQNVKAYADARERFTRERYGWRSDSHTRDSDRMVMFTTESRAQEESVLNLEHFKVLGRAHDMRYLVVTRTKIQFVGHDHLELILRAIARDPWCEEYKKEHHDRPPDMSTDTTPQGGVLHVRAYNHGLVLKEQYGVYDLEQDQRIKNREEIIRRFWDLGFATWRGRPPSVAQLRWSGPREHLEHLTKLADQYWNDQYRGRSEVAAKITSAYRSINRYAAWPGAW
jgi:hypothetical protein